MKLTTRDTHHLKQTGAAIRHARQVERTKTADLQALLADLPGANLVEVARITGISRPTLTKLAGRSSRSRAA